MTFEVRVRSLDQESPYAYPSRKVEIATSAGRVATPNRAATLYEYNKKATVPTNIPLDNAASLAVKRPNAATLEKFLEENGVARRWGREMRSAADRMSYSALSAYLVQPTTTDVPPPKKNGKRPKEPAAPSGIAYLRSSPAKLERFLRMLIQLQVDSGLDVVAVPHLGLPMSEYKDTARKISSAAAAAGMEPMFAFDLEYQKRGDKFEEAMSFLVRDVGARLVAFPNRSYTTVPLSYDVLAGYAESDVAFVSFDTDRSYRGSNPLSKMHSFPFIGTDIYAIKTPRFVPGASDGQATGASDGQATGASGGGSDGQATGASGGGSALDSVKFFEPSSLTIRPSAERAIDPDALLGEIGERGNARLRGILEEYGSMGDDTDKIGVLSSVSKVHELKSSTAEFASLRKWIDRGETAEYVKEKPRLESTLDDLERRRGRRGRRGR